MESICGHLGRPGDPDTPYAYPNTLNVCYATLKGYMAFEPVALAYQQQFCLSADHGLCTAYLRYLSAQRNGKNTPRATSYFEFFGLREEPFSIVPQSKFACESASQKEAHRWLRWLVDRRQGLGLLYGEIGLGKTLLCHVLYEELIAQPQYLPVLLLTPNFKSEYAFMAELLAKWEVTPERVRSLQHLETAAHAFLVGLANQNRTAVLIVDEAQMLSKALLHQVRKLLNWQDGGRQLLQVILAGQLQMMASMARMAALRDRAVVTHTLVPMNDAEVQSLIARRLHQAGRQGDLFTPSAIRLLCEKTGGMPRRVTILSLLSMWTAYEEGKRQITPDIVRLALDRAGASELELLRGVAAVPVPVEQASSNNGKNGTHGAKWPARLWRALAES